MRYTADTTRRWSDAGADEQLRLARHHRVAVDGEGGDVVVLAQDGPGWVRVPPVAVDLLRALDGATVGEVAAWEHVEEVRDLLDALYAAGLLLAGSRTGLRGDPGPRGTTGGGEAPPSALLLKLTGACDMACDYCYDYDAQRWHGRMDQDLARRLITECLVPDGTLTLMFHGGEPMLRFRQIQELVEHAERRAREVGAHVRHSVQTNGLHMTPAAVSYFREHRFTVGVSLDGPQRLHDLHRVDHRGRGTFERILRSFDRVGDFMREEVGYISVVPAGTSRDDLEDAWTFFRDLGVLSWKLLPADAEGRARSTPETDDFRRTFVEFLAARLEDVLDGRAARSFLTNLVQLVEPFLSADRRNMCMAMPCGASDELLVVDAVGGVRACDCTYDPAFALLPPASDAGTGPRRLLPLTPVATGTSGPPPTTNDRPARAPVPVERRAEAETSLVARARATPEAHALRAREEWLLTEAPCATCTWLHQCAGTCPARALATHGSLLALDELECRTRLALFPRVLADVSTAGSRLRRYHDDARRRGAAQFSAAGAPV